MFAHLNLFLSLIHYRNTESWFDCYFHKFLAYKGTLHGQKLILELKLDFLWRRVLKWKIYWQTSIYHAHWRVKEVKDDPAHRLLCYYHIYCIGIESWLSVKKVLLMKTVSLKTSNKHSVCGTDIVKHDIMILLFSQIKNYPRKSNFYSGLFDGLHRVKNNVWFLAVEGGKFFFTTVDKLLCAEKLSKKGKTVFWPFAPLNTEKELLMSERK